MKERARSFAIAAHGAQKYGDKPYSFHLDAVGSLVELHGEIAVTVAYLHDTAEDTAVTLQDLEASFGAFVAACVSLLTDEPGSTRKERKAKTYAKLSEVNGPLETALVVKTADRLANVRACIFDDNQRLLEVYRGEHQTFRNAAYRPGLCDAFWSELDVALSDPADSRPH